MSNSTHTLMLAPMAELSHRALRELIIEFEEKYEGESSYPAEARSFAEQNSQTKCSIAEPWNTLLTPFECRRDPAEARSFAPQNSQTKCSIAKSWNTLLTPFCGAQNPPKILYFTEMISAAGLLSGGPLEKYYLDNGPRPERLVYQLVGADSGQLVRAAAILDREESFGIDLNMGCAAPAITRTGAGVRWMEDPEKAARLVEQIRRLTKKQLSAKIRLGPKNMGSGARHPGGPAHGQTAAEQPLAGQTAAGRGRADSGDLPDFPYLLKFCRRLEEAGLDMITLHPRLAAEKFKRRARWDYVEALRAELTIPVTGNGDISSAAELAEKAAAGPVMAGRLLVREPWAFAGALSLANGAPTPPSPRPDSTFLQETGLRFLELLSRHQPPEFHLSRARRFFRYYCDNLTWAEYVRNKINREESLGGIEKVWRSYFAENPTVAD